ncbi:hypothetical protein [Luteimonas sp. R10]|uniref:hypothetical protein n=1 Tax=Luteimonas sp. R10 TaxID=3108176 RepID=UPI0030875B91|nr:hypothetical protein U3649_03020 [Luteimonas sp. R10]
MAPLRFVLLLTLLPLAGVQAQERDDYAAMLGWLAETRIDERAFNGASGAIGVNQSAGDLNQQANLRAFASGDAARATIAAHQARASEAFDAPTQATAVIGGRAFAGASGLASINQASGSGNAELNAVAVTLAQQGIREASDEQLSSPALASAGLQRLSSQGGAETAGRKVAVEASALRGFEGVLQLNQIAGSGNATDNQLVLSVQTVP